MCDLLDTSGDYLLPADIAATAQSMRNARISNRRINNSQLTALLPANLKMISSKKSGNQIQRISVTRIQTESVTSVALSSSKTQEAQKRFSITVKKRNTVQAIDLAQAGVNYPKEITDRYLQLPATLPPRVKELASSLTQPSDTPYDKAKTLKSYLAQFPYTLTIETPQPGVDGVDYFLFTQNQDIVPISLQR
jgi:hypothetical protein